MHRPAFSIALLAAALQAAPSLHAQDMPARKAGLWEIRHAPGMGMPPTVMQQCTDAASEAHAHRQGGEFNSVCSQGETQRQGNTITARSVCRLGTVTVTSQSVTTGDFSSTYKVVVNSRYEPPMMGRSTDSSTVEARWLGPCPPGHRPGEVRTLPVPR